MTSLASFKNPAAYHLLSYGTLLGSTLFQSFISGIIAFRTLPRPQFSTLQKATFPAYFTLQTVTPALMILTYPAGPRALLSSYSASASGSGDKLAFWLTATMLVTGAVNLLYVGPQTTEIMRLRKHQETRDGKKSYDKGPHSEEMQTLNKRLRIHLHEMAPSSVDPKLGPVVPNTPAQPPTYDIKLTGQHVTIVPTHPDHAADLFSQVNGADKASLFDYLFDDPPTSLDSFRASLATKASTTNPWTYTILLNGQVPRAVGMASLMRMDLPNRVIEVGSILYTPSLQRTPAATEAMYLLASYVFDTLGFRRYEWKCNALNEPSKRAAKRLGFVYEGTFRQHMIARGRNRDTAWFSIVDGEWADVKGAMEKWLDQSNFDGEGGQKRNLENFRTT
ncbi:hypothetical protein N0V90_000335 [Kalmusia sp. IMI 367209]|nr:hypothetical protein N0V90_000335 [Kalmusia sp. IMI 367209]